MRPFQLDSSMTTMGGTFYPTGWMVLMFPDERTAQRAGMVLADNDVPEDEMMLITPDDFRREILGAAGDDEILPSAGSEGDTVRRFAELARQGHYGVMVHCGKNDTSERITELLRDCPISYGQKYRTLVIEDVVA